MSECSGKPRPLAPGARNFLDQDGRVAEVAAAAVGLGQHGVEQALAPGLAPDFLGHDAVALPLGVEGHDFLVEEAPRLLAELFMVLAVDGALDQVLHGC
ncbi:precorrin-2 C20-methyltransferase [Alicycliphilus sp. B1]|nr:precorrin-2 C20-methyltransferase [Alicycliphilus sp. B1]